MKLIPKKTGHFKSFDGCRIYYEVRGEGQALVFAYGIGCLMNHWIHQVNYFSQNFTTILMDYRGHHKSGTPDNKNNLGVRDLAQDFIELLKHLEIPTASFFGHSFGVPIILEAYRIKPELFDKMILINGFAKNPLSNMFRSDFPDKTFSLIRKLYSFMPSTASFLWKKSLNHPISAYASALLGGFQLNLSQFKDIEIYTRGISSIDLDSFLRIFQNMVTYDGRSELKNIKCPCFIIGSRQDPITPIEDQRALLSIPNSEFLDMKQGAHCTQLDKPDIVNLKSEQFLLRQN